MAVLITPAIVVMSKVVAKRSSGISYQEHTHLPLSYGVPIPTLKFEP